MKKTKILVLTVVMSLGFSLKAYAFPAGETVLVVGNRAYDINTISSRFTDSDFTNYVSNNYNNIYYVTSDTNGTATIQDVFGGQTISESTLINKIGGKINYYSGSSTTTTEYWASENGQYKSSTDPSTTIKDQYVTLEITPKQISGKLYLFNFKLDQLVGVPGAAFFSVGTSSKVSLTQSPNCMIDISNVPSGIPIYIYSSDMSTIATATIPSTEAANIKTFTIKTVKFGSVTNPITTSESKYSVLGNLSNGGLLDSDSNYIYYINTADGNKIYKKNTSETENYPISDDKAGYITVYGNWVYYCNYSDNGKIYKVKTDGTLRQKISDNKGTNINVIDDKVYYVNGSDGGRIYSLDSAGNSTKLSDTEASYLVLGVNKYLFFSNINEGKNLYQIDTSAKVSKVDGSSSNAANYINVSGNSSLAYYVSGAGKVYRSGDAYNPLQIRIQTSNGLVDDKIANINISNNTIYYKSLTDGGKLYKVGTSGGVGQKVVNDTVDAIFVYYDTSSSKDYVYYTKGGKMYVLPMDGTTKATAITKPKNNNKVSSINAISTIYTSFNDSAKTIDQINVLSYLPEKVSAVMNDGTIQQLPVSWDLTSPKSKSGVYTYNGTVVGYGNKVTANLSVSSYDGLDASEVTADNEIGKNDTITIASGSLSNGAVVKVYDTTNTSKVAKSATVDSTGGVVIGGLNFGVDSGTVKVTVTKVGKAESPAINVPYGPERGNAPTVSGGSFASTTLSDNGTTTTVKGIQIVLDSTYQFYIGTYTDATKANNDSNSNWINATDNSGSYSSWNSSTSTVTINSVAIATKDLQSGGAGKKIFIRKAGNPPSTPAVFMVNPRVAAPSGIVFDELFGVIRGTTTSEEYSKDGGTTWIDCTAQTTNVGAYTTNPLRVRLKATKNTLAGQEAVQVKVTDIAGNNNNVAIITPAVVTPEDGTITNGGNKITLKSSVGVTWKVVDLSGQSTNMASIRSIDSQTAELTGYENGVVNVVATSTDGNNSQGSLNVNVTNQPVVTVKNTAELNNAVASGAKVIKLLGIGYKYDLSSLPTPTNSDGNLTIIGQDSTSVINVLTTSGTFGTVDGSAIKHLNLKNLTLKGVAGSSLSNVISVSGGTVTLDGVYFDSLVSTVGVNQDLLTASSVIINNSKFITSNSFNTAVIVSNGSVKNSLFNGNSNFSGETALSASGNVTIQGNSFTNYSQASECAIMLSSGFDVSKVGGVQKDYWNIINNSNIGIWLPGITDTDKATLMTNNSIDIKNTTILIKP